MIGRIVKLAVVGVAALGLSVAAQAQGMPPGPPPGPPMDRGSFAFEGMVGGFGGKVVTGAPFSAQMTRETVQVLSDGTHVDQKMTGNVARDSAGRTRQEMTFNNIGPLSASGQAPHIAFIRDPGAGKAYILDEDKQTVLTMNRPARAGAEGDARWMRQNDQSRHENANVQTTSLGTKTIDGLTVEGTRVTRTIPAGRIGNDKPMVITREEWYSSELQMVVSSTRTDPRFGTTTYQLTNINRSEPSESLFTVPSGYTSAPQRFHGPQAQPQANPDQN